MKSLHDEIRERQPADPASLGCVSYQSAGPGLVLCQWEGERWAMPWAQFVSARIVGSTGRQLEISFANYRVTLTGENLRGLVDDLALQRVGCLRDLPKTYRLQTKPGEPCITTIAVEPIAAVPPAPPP